METPINEFLISVGTLLAGIVGLIAPPNIIRGYEDFKDDPRKVKRTIRFMRIIGIFMTLISSIMLIAIITHWLRSR